VIICTRLPRPHYWPQVLGALQTQSLSVTRWELLVIDNASEPPLSSDLLPSWHPAARLVRESTLGLTPARWRGVVEAAAEVIIFVDDDNLLATDFLEQAVSIGKSHPELGAWGGNITLWFEVQPPAWVRRYQWLLTEKHLAANMVSRDPAHEASTPYGAGLCVRQAVARHYDRGLLSSPVRQALDRRGQSLVSGGDVDLALAACDLGMAKGVFPRLQVTHLIPPERTTEDYLLRLSAAKEFSRWVLAWCRSPEEAASDILPLRRHFKHLYDFVRTFGRRHRFLRARWRGRTAAGRFMRLARRVQDPGQALAQVLEEQFSVHPTIASSVGHDLPN
jgi:hypothetical protein